MNENRKTQNMFQVSVPSVCKMSATVLILLLISISCKPGEGKRIKDVIDTRSDWEFLARFCFLSSRSTAGQGRLEYSLKYPVAYGVQNLVFYYDTPGQWESVYKRDKSCQDKADVALDANNYFSMEPTRGLCSISNISGVQNYVCEGTLDFTSARERWWYVVVSRCGNAADSQYNDKIYLDVDLHLTNGDDFLHQEYSADEFYIVIIVIVFFILYCALWIASLSVAYVLVQRQLYHSTYRMYMAAITLWSLNLFCLVIAWVSYGVTGYEKTSLETLGRVLGSASHITFMLTLILIAKGFTIVRGRLKPKAYIKITVFICLYIVACIFLYIWEAVVMDPGLVLYFYESPPGYGSVLLTLLGWLWFTKAAVFTLKHYKGKTAFYMMLYTLYSIWFWAGPMVIMLAMFAMAKWTREKTVSGVEHFIAFVGHLVFFCLTLPSKVNSNFPYHVKTSQIGIDNSEQNSEREGEYTNITGAYWSTTGPNLEFFTTSKGAQSQGGPMYGPLAARPGGAGDPGSSRTNDSPPPPYPQAVALSSNSNINNEDNNNNNNNYDISTISSNNNNNMLPPLQPPMSTTVGLPLASRLPPLRASGLPPLVPSAPPIDDADEDLVSNSNYEPNQNFNNPNLMPVGMDLYSQPVKQKNVSRMFQVSKDTSLTNESHQSASSPESNPISNVNLEPLSELEINSQPLKEKKVSRMFEVNDKESEDSKQPIALPSFLSQRKDNSRMLKTSEPAPKPDDDLPTSSGVNPNLLSDDILYSKLAPLVGPLPDLEKKPSVRRKKKKKKEKKVPKEPEEPQVNEEEPEQQNAEPAPANDEDQAAAANSDTPIDPPDPEDPLNAKPLNKRKKKAKKFFINQ